MRLSIQLPRLALAAILTVTALQSAQARKVSVDFGDLNFATDGQNFDFAANVFGLSNGSINFDLNFGSGARRYDYCMNANGFVSFVGSGDPCSASGSPSGDYVAPFLSTLTDTGNSLSGFGLVDSIHSGSATDPFVAADATAAYRFIWQGTDAASNAILTELLLLDKGAGNFDLAFAYGSPDFGVDGAPATGQQIVNLGTNIAGPINGPFSTTTDYGYSVVNGTCTTCGGGTVTVPEPSTLVLFSCALLMLPFARRFRGSPRRD